jgi:hypothetical protein
MASAAEVFARTVLAFHPYAEEVVFIGGWVHALYLAEANASDRPVRTEDIDITLPHALLAGNRPTLLELAAAARYELQEVGTGSGILEIFQEDRDGRIIELDLLTESPDPRTPVEIAGQRGLTVHGYPGQGILLENARWITGGATSIRCSIPHAGSAFPRSRHTSWGRACLPPPGRGSRSRRRISSTSSKSPATPRSEATFPAGCASWANVIPLPSPPGAITSKPRS